MSKPETTPEATRPGSRSLEEVHRSVAIPQGHWWRRLFAFAGPAYMVSVGYLDPGNWATDLEGGARFGYKLIWVLLMSNLMAVLLQTLCARLGLVTGRDLAQACRDEYPRPIRWVLFILCEIAIDATDLAELVGTAIGLNLLFDIPLMGAVGVTAFDVFILLAIQRLGIRKMEGFILSLVFTVGVCFVIEIFLCNPSPAGIAAGFIPQALSDAELYVAIGILGATVMPHNLYLHSALVQTRDVPRSVEGVRQACRFNFIDSVVALNAAFFVNAAILIVAAAAFYNRGTVVTEIKQAHHLLEHLLGSRIAPIAFAVALICAGQSSTLTGTLAGQITMEGFLHLRMRPWLRRLLTRSLALIPVVIVVALMGDQGMYKLLILSQVVLSLQLPFAVVPLIKFTSSRAKMGGFCNPVWVRIVSWLVAAIIIALNGMLVYEVIGDWVTAAGPYGWIVLATSIPLTLSLAALLVWMVLQREVVPKPIPEVKVDDVVRTAIGQRFRRIGVALEARHSDATMLAEAVAMARAHRAELVLLHVVEGVGGQWYGGQTGDTESRDDRAYLASLAERLTPELSSDGVSIRTLLGYGDVPRELVRMVDEEHIDLLVVGGHGHRALGDVLHGGTITNVRHGMTVPLLAIRHRSGGGA